MRYPRNFTVHLGCFVTALLSLVLSAGPALGAHSTIDIEETAGLERENWPVQVGVPLPADADVQALQLVREEQDGSLHETRFQVLEVIEPAHFQDRQPRTAVKTVEIAFLADLPANASRSFRLYHSEPESPVNPVAEDNSTPRLDVEKAQRLQRTIDTGAMRFRLDPDSGQLIDYKLAGVDVTPRFGHRGDLPVHGGADVWSPPHSWGNVRAWDLDEDTHQIEYHETVGPIAWRLVRTGVVPRSNETSVSLSYTTFAGVPFILETTRMRFTNDTTVNAVRNNQLVFSRGQHTHGIYIDHDADVNAVRGYDPDDPEKRFHLLGTGPLPPDIPFIGMFHEGHGIGIGMVTLGRTNQSTSRIASVQDQGSSYYFFDAAIHSNEARNFFYFVRAEIFPAVYLHRTQYPYWTWHSTVVPRGSVFSSRSAILAFSLGNEADDERFEQLERWTELLRHPPRVVARLAD